MTGVGNGLDEAWARTRARIHAELGEQAFSSWFGCLRLDGVSRGQLFLSVPTAFLRKWLLSHYQDVIARGLASEFTLASRRVVINVNSPRKRRTPATPVPKILAVPAPEAGPLTGSPLNPRMTFPEFFTAGSNRLAFIEAQRCALELRPFYNPLYFHGAEGTGKTHLLQAIALAAAGAKRRVLYLTAERFIYGLARGLHASSGKARNDSVWDCLSSVDILIIDDMEFFPAGTRNIFRQVLDGFLDAGRQIVIAAGQPPCDLEWMDGGTRSRLSAGLCIEICRPEKALRIAILEARVSAAKRICPAFDVPAEVIDYVASTVRTSRGVEGAANRLLAHARLHGGPISIETATLAIAGLTGDPPRKKVTIEDIQKLAASHFNVSRDDILSARRTANVVRPRQIAMYLSKLLTPRSLPEIGRRSGGRDHTTVLHAVRKITDLIEGTNTLKDPRGPRAPDKLLAEDIAVLKAMLLS